MIQSLATGKSFGSKTQQNKYQLTVDSSTTLWYYNRVIKVTPKFEIGDLVLVANNVHDCRMPKTRMGVISENEDKDIYWITFTNGSVLKFHGSTLLPVKPSTNLGGNDG